MTKILLLIITTFITQSYAYEWRASGGGTVVGNGAGLVESNFQFAYLSLKKILPHCYQKNTCDLVQEEKEIIIKMNEIVVENANKKDRLVFLSEKANPGFFTTGVDEKYRIAKTFLNSQAPIYINTDLLYKDNGTPALSFQDILRILIHELGHQTGVKEHSGLDILGAKIATYSEEHTNYYQYKIADNQKLIFTVTNIETPVKSSIVIFNWINLGSIDLSDIITEGSECSYDSESFAGLEVINGHYSIGPKGVVNFEAWINVSCHESFSGEIFVYKRDLSVQLDENYKILGVLIK